MTDSDGHAFHPTVLREYDIRGVVGETLGEADARAIGRAFATIVGGARPTIAVGFDGRLSSPALEAAVVEGLIASGAHAVRIGRGPTPMLYFAVHTLGLDGGIMVTGSHNPPAYNGFKLMRGKQAFFGADIQALGRLARSGQFRAAQGDAAPRGVAADYVQRLRQDYRSDRALAVAWDVGNGATGDVLADLVTKLPGRHVVLNGIIDGRFPAHHPDPTVPANLEQLREAVLAEGCDVGIAFDGDGDRLGAVDGQGRILWADQMLALFARDVLAAHPGATIIADVKCSNTLFAEIARLGGKPLMWRTGHSLIKSKMHETQAPLAGEQSAHIFFADRYYGFDDALYGAIRLLDYVAHSGRTLAQLRDELPAVVNTPELRIPCAEDRKFQVVADVKKRLETARADVNTIDGVRVTTADGWWLLRASNTQDVLVARCEAATDAGLARLKASLVAQIRAAGLEPPPL